MQANTLPSPCFGRHYHTIRIARPLLIESAAPSFQPTAAFKTFNPLILPIQGHPTAESVKSSNPRYP
jgi:hypothetical protein